MGQKAITIYTPSGASAHISAEDDAFVHRCMLGGDSGIIGSLSCVKVDDNTVRLSGGGVSNHGYILWIPEGETLELSVDAGVAGYNRIDTVASVFSRGGGDVADTHTLAVVKGTAVTGTPSAPSLTTSALLSSGNVNQIALFNVRITGSEITSVSRVATLLPAGSSAPNITYGTGEPTGGNDGDIYFKIES